MCIFIVQLFYLSSNQSSAQLLIDETIPIDVEYQRAYTKRYVDVVVVFLQIYILIRFLELDEYIAIMLHGMRLILPNILVFTVFWWIIITFFAQIISVTYGQLKSGYAANQISLVSTLST